MPRIAVQPLNDELRASIRNSTEGLIQPMVDYRFGAGQARAECREVRQGSLDLLVYVTAVGGSAYVFVKDYDKLRANGMLLAADIKKGCGKLKRAIEGKAKKLLKNDGKK